MTIATLTVISPLASSPDGDHQEMHLFCIQVDQSLTWIKSHADELAARCVGHERYHALMVEPGRSPLLAAQG